jgi:hypothetical protein
MPQEESESVTLMPEVVSNVAHIPDTITTLPADALEAPTAARQGEPTPNQDWAVEDGVRASVDRMPDEAVLGTTPELCQRGVSGRVRRNIF